MSTNGIAALDASGGYELSTTKVKLCDADFDFIHFEKDDAGPERFAVTIEGNSESNCMRIKQQILENQAIVNRLIKEHDELADFVERNDGSVRLVEFKAQLALLRRILTTFHSKGKGRNS